jgi:hypothetical protein
MEVNLTVALLIATLVAVVALCWGYVIGLHQSHLGTGCPFDVSDKPAFLGKQEVVPRIPYETALPDRPAAEDVR